MRSRIVRGLIVFTIALCSLVGRSTAADATLAFTPGAEQGYFNFDTGELRGTLRLDGKLQGIPEMVHAASGREVTFGGGHVGLSSPYRVFSTDTRYGHAARDWPSVPRLLDDGAVEAVFPPADDHPLELTLIYRWASPDTLDVETIAKPLADMPRFEVFMSNYFGEGFSASVYLQPPGKTKGASPGFVAPEFSPLVDGNYLMFPRDREAAEIIFDRRWEAPPNPVQWCVSRYLAAPLAMRRHAGSGLVALLMAPPEDCFAVATPYEKNPPDGIANHRSLYLSLFGGDVEKGRTVRARSRLVVRQGLSDADAVERYKAYLAENRE
jgi:hypothetical protein